MSNVIKLSDFKRNKPNPFDEMAAYVMQSMWGEVKKALDSLEQSSDADIAFYAGEVRRHAYAMEHSMAKINNKVNDL